MGPKVDALSKELYGDALGSHATPSEVSLTYYVYPEAVKSVKMTPEIAPEGPIYDADDYRRRFPDGRIGANPALASVADGQRLYDAAVEDTIADFEAFVA
jgi:creatinine amidohydrolase